MKTKSRNLLYPIPIAEAVILFGTAKDENKKEEEYLVYWFLDNFEFYSSNVNQRKPNNLEYDYKKNEILIYDKEWSSQIGELTWDETPNNLKKIKNWGRCVNVYYKASKAK